MTQDADTNNDENFDWNVENEIKLFEAMLGHKPVGMFLIWDKYHYQLILIIVIRLHCFIC